jgi:hypothetical protein
VGAVGGDSRLGLWPGRWGWVAIPSGGRDLQSFGVSGVRSLKLATGVRVFSRMGRSAGGITEYGGWPLWWAGCWLVIFSDWGGLVRYAVALAFASVLWVILAFIQCFGLSE